MKSGIVQTKFIENILLPAVQLWAVDESVNIHVNEAHTTTTTTKMRWNSEMHKHGGKKEVCSETKRPKIAFHSKPVSVWIWKPAIFVVVDSAFSKGNKLIESVWYSKWMPTNQITLFRCMKFHVRTTE